MLCPFIYLARLLGFIPLVIIWSGWIIFDGVVLGLRSIKADFKEDYPELKSDFIKALHGKAIG